MIILALDSALSSCSAAVIKDDETLCGIFEDRGRGQAECLIPMCQRVCRGAQISFDDLDGIAVTRGPGTFTGLRIGLAAAKGLALALDIPLVGVTTLEAVAQNAADADYVGRIAIAHDARRAQVYWQIFDLKDRRSVPVSDAVAVSLEDVEQQLDHKVTMMAGTGALLIKPFLSADRLTHLEIQSQPNAATVGRIAAGRFGGQNAGDEVAPLYLRPPDAAAAQPVIYSFQNQ